MASIPETAGQIIQDAAVYAGIGDIYNAGDGTVTSFAMRILNDLMDSNSALEKTIFDITEGTFNMPVNPVNNLVQVGPGQALNVRPVMVERVEIVDAQSVSHRVDVIGVDEWARIIYKPAPGRPEVYYNDGNVPISNWYFWPNPSFTGDVCHVWFWNLLPSFTLISDQLIAPPAFTWFAKTQLGLNLMAFFRKEPTALQTRIANRAEANARRLNNQPKVLETDLPMQYVRTFNIYTGI